MKLNFASIPFDKDGRVEIPELMLRTMHGDPIGLIHGAANISMNIKFSEPSELEFDIPAELNGIPNPDYDRVTGHKQIYTEHYGIYETLNPSVEDDGISVIKHVTAYSLEKELDHKRFFIEEGTFNFWNPVTPDNTVLGRVVEKAVGWHIGYVSPSLYGLYRTFDQVDDELLNFVYNTLSEKYLCCAVFDTYNHTIDFYDRNVDLGTLPIALDHDNLIVTMNNSEVSEELVTALRPYGSDQLSIREVNPTGSPWIYDLTNFIENGDIPSALVTKWRAWEAKIAARREYYIALISLRASTSARLLSEKAKLTDMNSAREVLQTQRSAIIQALELSANESEREQWQQQLTEKTAEINAQTSTIATQEELCTSFERLLDPSISGSYAEKIQVVVNDLAFTNTANFTVAEQEALQHYFIESDLTEETFVATDIDTTISGQSMQITSNTTFSVTGSKISRLSISEGINKTIYSIDGGNLTVGGLIAGGIVGGTLEVDSSKNFVFSVHCGEMTVNGTYATKMMVTANGKYTSLSNDISQNVVDGVTSYIGTTVTFETKSASMYVTATISGLQQFAVQRQLYDFAVEELKNLATYTYEFSVEAGNFLFAREFDQFRNELELGKGIYLNVEGLKVVTPLIEMSFNFDDESKLSLVFSNRIKRHDPVNTLKDLVEKSYSKTRSIDGGKYTQSQVNNQASAVSAFMNAALDAAKNRILAAGNQSVVIDGAGIHIGQTEGEDRKYQLGIVNNMIAMTDDNWEHAKLAIGLFRTPDNGTFFGVNADVIAGKLVVGENLTIDTGSGAFRVDSSGVYIDSLQFYVRPGETGSSSSLDDIITGIESEIEGTITTYYDDTVPQDAHTGDLWFVTDDVSETTYKKNELYRWSGSQWDQINDAEAIAAASTAAAAANAASNAQATADSKIETYRQGTNPATTWTTPTEKQKHIGDVWYNSAKTTVDGCLSKKAYRWSGNQWQPIEDGDISTLNTFKTTTTATLSKVINANGYLKASELRGAIDATNSAMQNGSGNVIFDSKGIYLLNNTTKASSTKAVWMNENGILFGSGTAGNIEKESGTAGAWTWTTAIGHDGIVADAIAAGTISGMTISGGEITIGKNFKVDTSGNLTAANGTFSGTLKATTLDGNLTGNNKWIIGAGLSIGNGATQSSGAFYVDTSGSLKIGGNSFKVTSAGNVTITKGSISIGGTSTAPKFKVDASGNVTLSGTITWGSTSKPWEGDIPTDYLTEDSASTLITNKLVASPTISGATIKGSIFTNSQGGAYITIGSTDTTGDYGDFVMYRKTVSGYSEAFKFYDNSDGVAFYCNNTTIWWVGATNSFHFSQPVDCTSITLSTNVMTVNYGTNAPGNKTSGYGTPGAVYFKI